jgi:hypothetical protein
MQSVTITLVVPQTAGLGWATASCLDALIHHEFWADSLVAAANTNCLMGNPVASPDRLLVPEVDWVKGQVTAVSGFSLRSCGHETQSLCFTCGRGGGAGERQLATEVQVDISINNINNIIIFMVKFIKSLLSLWKCEALFVF